MISFEIWDQRENQVENFPLINQDYFSQFPLIKNAASSSKVKERRVLNFHSNCHSQRILSLECSHEISRVVGDVIFWGKTKKYSRSSCEEFLLWSRESALSHLMFEGTEYILYLFGFWLGFWLQFLLVINFKAIAKIFLKIKLGLILMVSYFSSFQPSNFFRKLF